MELTKEQLAILASDGNIRINAVAGSGKTTTIIEYARTRPPGSRILYLAFNKSVKLEAAEKFAAKKLNNVRVETAHSLAYRHVVRKHGFTVRNQNYKTHEIAELLGLEGDGEKHAEYMIANHINRFISYYCNSNKQRIEDLRYLDIVSDPKARAFVRKFYRYIVKQASDLLKKMRAGEIDITHDFYLKQFQLEQPELPFDYILFDEGQDASPAMLDVFLQQKAVKVIVGDAHQQIYSWRFAVNSLEQADFPTYHLSTSFRFGQDIADLAMSVLGWKNHLAPYKPIAVNGKGNPVNRQSRAVLARTNLGLLMKAIQYVIEEKTVNSVYFEGNFSSYTYADDGASLYDVLNLYTGKRHLIRDKLIRSMRDLKELEEYNDKTEDRELQIMVEIVRQYEDRIPDILKTIRLKHVEDGQRSQADMIFSTVHRSKGMEYDEVELADDFVTEEKLMKYKDDSKNQLDLQRANEEINLLYVAVTRTRSVLLIPFKLVPVSFGTRGNILVTGIPETEEEELAGDEEELRFFPGSFTEKEEPEKAYSVLKIREKHPSAYLPWTSEHDSELAGMFLDLVPIRNLAVHFGRTRGAIRSRIKKLLDSDD
jgi:F-box protein, helicase, 18